MGCNPTPTERSRCSWDSVRRESRAYSAPEPFIWSPPISLSMSANARSMARRLLFSVGGGVAMGILREG